MTQAIRIHPDSRYFVCIKTGKPLPPEAAADIADGLNAWWESGRKFYVGIVGDNADITFERLPERTDPAGWVLTNEGHERVTP